jgi:hypothetical protein
MAERVQRFRATNGRVIGVLGAVVCVLVAVTLVVSEPAHVAVAGVLACGFALVLVWLAMLRPSVSATESDLHLRNVFESVSIPLASIDTVVVRRYLLVRSGGKKYVCPAISRSLRKSVRAELKWRPQPMMSASNVLDRIGAGPDGAPESGRAQDLAYADFVEQQIQQLAAYDRARRGIEERSEEEYDLGSHVVRRTHWLEIGALGALALAFVLALIV